LKFLQNHDLFDRTRPGPAFEETVENGSRGIGIPLDVLNDAVEQLLMIQGDTLGFVQGNQGANEELQMFLLQGNGKTIDNGTENFQEFGNTIVAFRFIDKTIFEIKDR
jgi:hypothetical protein